MTEQRGSRSAFPLHTIGVALFFPLFILAQNADQWIDLSVAIVPLIVCVGCGSVLLVVCSRLFGGWQRGGLVATLLLVLFFTAGHVSIALRPPSPLIIAALWVGLALLGLAVIGRGRGWHADANRALNLAVGLLVTVNAVSLGGYLVSQSGQTMGQSSAIVPLGTVSERPDIYYLIFDRYANEKTLADVYDFDNSPFIRALEDRGFTVARDAWANYGKTSLSLVSSLSMDFLDADALRAASSSTFGPIHAALRGHLAVPETLTSIGYEYVHVATWWEPSATNVDADQVEVYATKAEYPEALAETTALGLFGTNGLSAASADPEVLDQPNLNQRFTLYEFEQVAEAADLEGPTYVFGHFLVPHPPYVFNADGSQQTVEQQAERGVNGSYVEQIRWTNRAILDLLDRLLAVPLDEQPVVIIQADEGPYPPRFEADQDGFEWLKATPAEVSQKFGILNAYHLPGVVPSTVGVTDQTSPVNAFRIVFDTYLGGDLPLLPDEVYLSPDEQHLYDFVPYDRPD